MSSTGQDQLIETDETATTHQDEDQSADSPHPESQDCPECGAETVHRTGTGERVCTDCGLVVEENVIDHGPEWRAFTHAERQAKSRVGAPTTVTMHDKGLTTTIGWRDEDAHGRSVSPRKRGQLLRLRAWQRRLRTANARERNLQFALTEIDRMASALAIPEAVREMASVIYRQALDQELLPGRSIEGVATSALYAACRKSTIPRSLDELATVARIDRKRLARTYRYLDTELGLEITPEDPAQYVPRFCSTLGVSTEVEQTATEVLEVAAEHDLISGKSPPGLAGAAIYAASLLCDEKCTQEEIADVANITVVTIRNRYQEQIEAINAELTVSESPP